MRECEVLNLNEIRFSPQILELPCSGEPYIWAYLRATRRASPSVPP